MDTAPERSDMRLQKRCCNTNSGQYELIRVWSSLTAKCCVNCTNQWIIEYLNTNGFQAEDFPSEGRLQITSRDVMAFVWRVSLNIGGIREAFTFAYGAIRIGRIVAILILVSMREICLCIDDEPATAKRIVNCTIQWIFERKCVPSGRLSVWAATTYWKLGCHDICLKCLSI